MGNFHGNDRLVSTREKLGNWTDGRILWRHSVPTHFLAMIDSFSVLVGWRHTLARRWRPACSSRKTSSERKRLRQRRRRRQRLQQRKRRRRQKQRRRKRHRRQQAPSRNITESCDVLLRLSPAPPMTRAAAFRLWRCERWRTYAAWRSVHRYRLHGWTTT